jgi:DNA-binding FadR family transcriptional regulator
MSTNDHRASLREALRGVSAATERFHSILAGSSGNRVLDLHASSLISVEREHVGPIFTEARDRELSLRTHDRIAEAILNRDLAGAEALARRHIEAVSKVMEAMQGRRLVERIEWKA